MLSHPRVKKVMMLHADGVLHSAHDIASLHACLYPGAQEMLRELYHANYQVVVLVEKDASYTSALLVAEGLPCTPVYASSECSLSSSTSHFLLHICEKEKVHPDECWLLDACAERRALASDLGMSVVDVIREERATVAAEVATLCCDAFMRLGILSVPDVPFSADMNRGKYPSLFGLHNGAAVKYVPTEGRSVLIDAPNSDGNLRNRCLYESLLAQLIIDKGRAYWEPSFHKINQLFLADIDIKIAATDKVLYEPYFEKLRTVLRKDALLTSDDSMDALRAALAALFAEPFDLTRVSQFYYNVWLFHYGPAELEPFAFLVDALKATRAEAHVVTDLACLLIVKRCPDLAHNIVSRSHAYVLSQPWLTCGAPQLRGRARREGESAHAVTMGIVSEDEPRAIPMISHFAAKMFFRPAREHPIAQTLQASGGAVIGGSSGTLGRNMYMLAPLVESGLLTFDELMGYVMGFMADLIYRGHHSYAEVAVVADKILHPLKPWCDSLRDPVSFYEQLLTPAFRASAAYQTFVLNAEGLLMAERAEDRETHFFQLRRVACE